MKYLFAFIFIFFSLHVLGQEHYLGIKRGIGLTGMSAELEIYSREGHRYGDFSELTYEYIFKKHFYLGSGICHNQRGYKFASSEKLQLANGTVFTFSYDNRFDYLSLPVYCGFRFGKRVFGNVNLGGFFSELIYAKGTRCMYDLNGSLLGTEQSVFTSRVSRNDFAMFTEIGGGFNLKEWLILFTSLSYQYSITVTRYVPWNIGYHYGETLCLGVKFRL